MGSVYDSFLSKKDIAKMQELSQKIDEIWEELDNFRNSLCSETDDDFRRRYPGFDNDVDLIDEALEKLSEASSNLWSVGEGVDDYY